MKLKRHFFVSEDLDDLERFEEELESADIVTPQIHLLTLDDAGAHSHTHLHEVSDFMKTDLVHAGLIGAVIGAVLAAFVLMLASVAGWTDTTVGWVPFGFLAVVLLGFFTWQGGLWGIEQPNVHFREFEQTLSEGKHLFFVDIEPGQEKAVKKALQNHKNIRPAGIGMGAPHWIVIWQHRLKRFFTEVFP